MLGEYLPDVCTSPCTGRVLNVFVHYRFDRMSVYGYANQQEVKPSMPQQDSGPEVSGVTCQAKEITDQPEAALVSGHQPAKHTCQHIVKAVVA